MYEYNARCVNVHDGDTVTLDVDLGFDVWHIGLFRLLGCNARELSQPGGKDARDALATLLLDEDVIVRSVKPDKFGDRYDADIVMRDGTVLVQWLIAQQWAAAWDGKGTKPVPVWPRTVMDVQWNATRRTEAAEDNDVSER